MSKESKVRYISCLIGVLMASVSFTGCSTAEAETVPANASLQDTSASVDTAILDEFYSQTELLSSSYEQNTLSETDLSKACATAILLQEELTNNVNLQSDTTYAEKINKAYGMLLQMDITTPGLDLQGDVAGVFPKLVDATETLVLTVGGDTAEGDSSIVSSAPVVETSSSPTLSSSSGVSSKPTSQAPTSKVESKVESRSTSKSSSSTSKATSKPASTAPAQAKPESKPKSTAPAPAPKSKPTSTAPAPAPKPTENTGSIKTLYSGSTYGAKSQSEFDFVMSKANAAKSSSKYKSTYDFYSGASDSDYKTYLGVERSGTWTEIAALTSYVGSGGQGSGSAGSAYDFFTGKQTMCADRAKAIQAVLQANGYDAKLALGTRNGVPHMWTLVKVGGSWYHLEGKSGYSTSVPAGYVMNSSAYNY
ncbi:MAG: hypothetical protein E7569_05590 [Ruminococcaceae bacterium]|nr:hypothetical protein [Oscillospiraceae bacterium]